VQVSFSCQCVSILGDISFIVGYSWIMDTGTGTGTAVGYSVRDKLVVLECTQRLLICPSSPCTSSSPSAAASAADDINNKVEDCHEEASDSLDNGDNYVGNGADDSRNAVSDCREYSSHDFVFVCFGLFRLKSNHPHL